MAKTMKCFKQNKVFSKITQNDEFLKPHLKLVKMLRATIAFIKSKFKFQTHLIN